MYICVFCIDSYQIYVFFYGKVLLYHKAWRRQRLAEELGELYLAVNAAPAALCDGWIASPSAARNASFRAT